MNLALHGFLLQVFVSILDFRHVRLLCSAGEPGYLDFDNLPETNFSCQGKVIGGYYADVEAGCQMFHVCTIGQKDEIMDIKFLCLNGTVFDQETRVCERVDEVDCSKSERFYNLNLELYGNNAVTLSLHETDDEDDLTIDSVEDHQLRTTSARPSTTSTTSTTTSRPSKPSTTAASGSFQHPSGYPQHYQPQPPFPQVHTSQSKSLYDDKNGGYHHQYIFHSDERSASNQATSYQLFSNQGAVSSTTVPPAPPPPPPPQIHQIRYSSTVGPPPQIIHSEPSTVTPLFHATSPTIQTLLNSNANSPAALINPIFHNHGIASTTEQFTVHNNNPRETTDYRDDGDQDIRTLEAIQSANKGKISKLTISPVPSQQDTSRIVQAKTSQTSQKQQRISGNFFPTPAIVETTMRSFYPTPRPSPKPPQLSHSVTHHITQHIHVSPGVTAPQLKPHQITINLPPLDIQRIVQNPSPLLPSQSRVIVTAKASVSDESGRPLNTTQLVTLPLPTIPASYDDYKEGDESFDPFYRDVPKIRKNRENVIRKMRTTRGKRSLEQPHHFIYGADSRQDKDFKVIRKSEPCQNEDNAMKKERTRAQVNIDDFQALKDSLIKFRDILFSDDANEDFSRNDAGENNDSTERVKTDGETFNTTSVKQEKDNAIRKVDFLVDLETEASKHFNLNKNTDKDEEEEKTSHEDSSPNIGINKSVDKEKQSIKNTSELEFEIYTESTTVRPRKNESRGDVIDVTILDSDNDFKVKAAKTDAPIEVIIEEETKSGTRDASKIDEKVVHREQVAGHLIKDESGKRSNSVADEREQLAVPRNTIKRTGAKNSGERQPGARRKGSRSRSSRRRISSRIRQPKTKNVETIQQKEDVERTTSTIATVDLTTVTSTSTVASTTSTTTVTPAVAVFETKVAKQIDSNIFGDSESQTFKEVDTRAIGQRDATYSKNLQSDKSHDASESKDMERSFDRQVAKDLSRNSELNADKVQEGNREKESSTDHVQSTDEKDMIFTENPLSAKEMRSTEVTNIHEEKKSSNEEFSFKEYETPDDDEVNTSTNKGEIEENSQDESSKVSSDEVTVPHESNLEQEDASERSSTDISDEEQSSTVSYSEEINSEELNEYQDTTENTSTENTSSIQEDYREYSDSTEGTYTTRDYTTNSEEYTDSQEDVAASTEEGSTEGVLKFTDELPLSDYRENAETTEESSASYESDTHDYVDDNYEPENYKGTEVATKSNESEEDTSEEKDDEQKKDMLAKVDDSTEAETQTDVAGVTDVKNLQIIADLISTLLTTTTTSTTTASITTVPITTTEPSTTITNTITTPRPTSTTTRRPTTTTPRATPPKLFKPTGNRRIYAYSPPTTTPNPVVIKPRFGLFNPKPAKPTKTYNELAPKPMIRKIVLPTRKAATTTTVSTTTLLDTENPEITTELVTETTAGATISSTMAETTMAAATTTTTAPITTTTTAAVAATTVAETTTTESSKSEENALESKLEANEHIPLDSSAKNDQLDKVDQLPSPSEQNTPVNSSKDIDLRMTTIKIETFTPYPLSRLSTVASTERITEKMDVKPQETTENIEDILAMTIPTTMPSKKPAYVEITPKTEKYLETTEISTSASTAKVYQQETPSISSVPPVPERATSVSIVTTTLPKAEDADLDASMEIAILRPSGRKPAKSRKHPSFNCLEREMYRFYGDFRDCRLFHYCSPGFTSRQVLDFRFVCEEGTAFDEVTQSCRHDVPNRKCRNRS